MQQLISQIQQCHHCQAHLPLPAKPIVQLAPEAKILIIGQAPGIKAHQAGIAFDDASGERLRDWLGVSRSQFYDPKLFAIMPMGFCYPGTGKSGDLAPRKECAPLWHPAVLSHLSQVQLTLLIGQYAQRQYLTPKPKTLTETVKAWQQYQEQGLPLPHPSPRNNIWLKKNPWFEQELLPSLKSQVADILN
ncbi:MAG: uracil-DNA glycosylase family protein [Vibrio sp.]